VPAPENLIIDTPEQIALEFPLAGIGSRFLAIAFDSVLQLGALLLLVGLGLAARRFAAVSVRAIGPWALAALTAGLFLVYNGYFAIFESLWNGQTPGKRMVGLRVIDVSGRPVTVYGAIIRNLIRIVDQIPGIYAIAILSVLITRRQQRLGDLAAGTVVVHERLEAIVPVLDRVPAATSHGARKLTAEEAVLVEGFLRRRADLDSWVRLRTAERIASRMIERLGLTGVEPDERLLEELAAEYRR
jgi:uncharacterized RDD family membrane protein YckC